MPEITKDDILSALGEFFTVEEGGGGNDDTDQGKGGKGDEGKGKGDEGKGDQGGDVRSVIREELDSFFADEGKGGKQQPPPKGEPGDVRGMVREALGEFFTFVDDEGDGGSGGQHQGTRQQRTRSDADDGSLREAFKRFRQEEAHEAEHAGLKTRDSAPKGTRGPLARAFHWGDD